VREKLGEETGLPFLPMHSPISRPHRKPVANDSEGFTEEETSLFEKRFENGYDLTHDSRYNLWLSQYHPESTVQRLPYSGSAVSTFLNYPSPPDRSKTEPKSCGRVLTSAENLEIMNEKEREKERKKEEKERKKEERERKKEEKERKKKGREEEKRQKALVKKTQSGLLFSFVTSLIQIHGHYMQCI